MGVPGVRAEDARAFTAALREALAEPGPRLIEARVSPGSIGEIGAVRSSAWIWDSSSTQSTTARSCALR